jgi:hypothetical protein
MMRLHPEGRDVATAFEEVIGVREAFGGLKPPPKDEVTIAGADPVLSTRFKIACDYTTGYLAAYGILLALAQRARDGGSYHVRASLCQSGMFVYRQGKVAFPGLDLDLSAAELDAIRIESRPKSGPLRHLGPILEFSEAQPHWTQPTPHLGGDAPEWLEVGARAAAAE